jgi:hypothetical protein
VVLFYANEDGKHAGEFMEISAAGKVTRVVVNYDG